MESTWKSSKLELRGKEWTLPLEVGKMSSVRHSSRDFGCSWDEQLAISAQLGIFDISPKRARIPLEKLQDGSLYEVPLPSPWYHPQIRTICTLGILFRFGLVKSGDTVEATIRRNSKLVKLTGRIHATVF
jgi:hypothetical protein